MFKKVSFFLLSVGVVFIFFLSLFRYILKRPETAIKKVDKLVIGNDKNTVNEFKTIQRTSNKPLQSFSDTDLGISFKFSPLWPRPKVEKQEDSAQIEFNNGVKISIGKNLNTTSANKNIKTVSVFGSSNTIVVSYNTETIDKDSINQITNSIQIIPTSTPTAAPQTETIPTTSPDSYPTSRPTPNPTEFYSASSECTYGCLSEKKF